MIMIKFEREYYTKLREAAKLSNVAISDMTGLEKGKLRNFEEGSEVTTSEIVSYFTKIASIFCVTPGDLMIYEYEYQLARLDFYGKVGENDE